jgi:iron uptake system component EfeO
MRTSLAALAAFVLAGCSGAASETRPPWSQLWPGLPVNSIQAVSDGCVAQPSALSGEQVVAVSNGSAVPLDLRITTADSPAAVFELEPIAPATTRARTARLGPGHYRYACFFEEKPVMYSEPFTVAGAGAGDGVAAVLPVSMQDLDPVARAYEQWVKTLLPQLRAHARAMAVGGDTGKREWTHAHRIYETLGAAYDAFGDTGEAVEDAFAQAESALWTGGGDAAQVAGKLSDSVDALASGFPEEQVDPLALGLRAHEIVEDAVEKTLTGRDDHGSHTMFVTLAANLEGVAKLMDLLGPLLRERFPGLDRLRGELSAAQSLIAAGATGGQQRLNAVFSQLAEDLAPVAAICDIRRDK